MRQLPGIRFETLSPPVSDELPRMDIAAFVGFTASGPIHVPVVVEDIAQFSDLFGADIAIARTDLHGETVYGYVAPAVRAFFRNGGQRCWVVRVTGAATANSFRIPGLSWVQEDESLAQTFAVARSEGSWSDSLSVRTSLSSQTIPLAGVSLAGRTADFPASARDAILPGELLRFSQRAPGHAPVTILATVAARVSSTQVALQDIFWGTGADPSDWTMWLGGSPPVELNAAEWVGERLRFEMVVEDVGNRVTRLRDLAFASAHPRYWASLLTDRELFADNAAVPTGLIAEAATPRFPLAGEQRGALYLPVGMSFLFSDGQGPEPLAETALERDGLKTFSSDLFLDQQLRETGVNDLLSEADYIRYQSSQPRTLTGIHAALAIEEATLICAPDATQRTWSRAFTLPPDPPIPSPPLERPDWFTFLDCKTKPPIPRVVKPPFDHFLDCSIHVVPAPILAQTAPDAHGSFILSWSAAPGGTFVLEQAPTTDFSGAEELYRGPATQLKLYGYSPGVYYYRVRVEVGGTSSDYSNGVVIRVDHPIDWVLDPVEQYDERDLLDVHRALMRMSAARGDLLALLSVPRHYREIEALSHVAKLVSARTGTSDAGTYSYGALYHPWLTGREENQLDVLRTSPPDGAIAGTLATRSLNRGAWIAPANEPLHGVVAFSAAVSRAYWQALQDAQVNVIRQEPAGFMCLDSDTLSTDPDVQPINVRRLLMLLRKTALRLGARYVFEPSSDSFRRTVQRGFESMLETMFFRGAFSGRSPSSAFQVVTDDSLNTPQSVELGRFIVDLKVAPSVPLTFLTVRLMQTADRTSVTEGVGA